MWEKNNTVNSKWKFLPVAYKRRPLAVFTSKRQDWILPKIVAVFLRFFCRNSSEKVVYIWTEGTLKKQRVLLLNLRINKIEKITRNTQWTLSNKCCITSLPCTIRILSWIFILNFLHMAFFKYRGIECTIRAYMSRVTHVIQNLRKSSKLMHIPALPMLHDTCIYSAYSST